MSSPKATDESLTKIDILAFGWKELVQLQDLYSLPDGTLQLPFDWWNAMSKKEQSRLARQIKSIIYREKTHDLDLERETICYNDLVLDGGRPLFPIEELEAVSRDPKPRLKMLKSWILRLDTNEKWKVFTRQFRWWQDFRKWQTDNRSLEDSRGVNAEGEEDEIWPRHQKGREERGLWCREKDCNGFADYAKAVHRRLAQHNFTQPFKLDEDIRKQDRLTTWVEYLNYEYWWFDRHIESFKRSKCDREEAWQELVDGKLLSGHETREYLNRHVFSDGFCNPDFWKDIVAQAIRTVEVARAAVREEMVIGTPKSEAVREETVLETPESEAVMKATMAIKRASSTFEPEYLLSLPSRLQSLQQATANLGSSEAEWECERNRVGLFDKFADARGAMKKARKAAKRQKTVVHWVRDQVHLIEAEMLHAEANQAESTTAKTPIANNDELSGEEVDSDRWSWSWKSDTPVSDDEKQPSVDHADSSQADSTTTIRPVNEELPGGEVDTDQWSWSWKRDTPVSDDEKQPSADHADSSQADSTTTKRPVGEDDEELPGEPSAKRQKVDHIELSTHSSTSPVAVTENREAGPEPRVVEDPESPVVEDPEPEPHVDKDPESPVVEDLESPVADAPEPAPHVVEDSESPLTDPPVSPLTNPLELEPRVVGEDLDDTQDKDQGPQATQSAVMHASRSVDATGEGPISSRLRKRDLAKVQSSSGSVDAPQPSNPKPKPKSKPKPKPKGKAKGKK
ncbi:hypothetical protein QQX98_007028 [Neonectria punicea]|uniref:C2H2-type domain-containing protein n=1 Tax=Neonectria punicea TaxID=979145 RepID=A0ABR1GZ14_9HYPO